MGVAILNGLALHAHRAPGVHATQLTDSPRRIYAATYGDPPTPATTALLPLGVPQTDAGGASACRALRSEATQPSSLS